MLSPPIFTVNIALPVVLVEMNAWPIVLCGTGQLNCIKDVTHLVGVVHQMDDPRALSCTDERRDL